MARGGTGGCSVKAGWPPRSTIGVQCQSVPFGFVGPRGARPFREGEQKGAAKSSEGLCLCPCRPISMVSSRCSGDFFAEFLSGDLRHGRLGGVERAEYTTPAPLAPAPNRQGGGSHSSAA